MTLSVFTYEAANEYGSLEQFDMDPATATVMDIMSKVRESTKLQNSHVKVGMRLYSYVDHVPGELINDPEKDPLVLSATLDELRRSGRVQFEEDRRGLHLKVLVDGCRTAEEEASFTQEQSWSTEYEVAALMRDVDILKKERDVFARLAAAAMNADEGTKAGAKAHPYSSFVLLVSEATMRAADEGDVPTLRVLFGRLLARQAPGSNPSNDNDADEGSEITEKCRPVVDKDGLTPLHRAARNGHTDAVRVLVEEFDMDVNAKSNEGRTPLHMASANSHSETARALKDLGAL